MEKTPEHIFCNKSWKITHPRGKPTKPATIDNLSESWDLFCTPDLYPYYITLIMSNYCWRFFLWKNIFISLPHSWSKPQILTVDKFLQIRIIIHFSMIVCLLSHPSLTKLLIHLYPGRIGFSYMQFLILA